MNVRGADFVVYQVSDISRSVPFYRDTLGLAYTGGHGWSPGDEKPEEAWIEFDVPPTTLALYQSAGDTSFAPGGTLALSVDNVEETLSELKAKGVKCLWEEHIDTPVCHFAIVFDPDDNQIGIHWRKDGTCG